MKNLNQNQLEAVNHEYGPLLVVAGAGTGKTSLITSRIVHLMNNKNVHPDNILAVTFTEKAAKEMLGRLDEVMPLSYYEPKISTYHSFCQEILRNDGHEMGLNTNFKLIADSEQWLLLRKEIYNFALKELRPKNNPGKYISDLLKLFSKCVDENVSSNDLIKFSLNCEDGIEKKKWEEVSFLFDKYQEIKLRDSKLDFGDLITFAYKLFLEKPYILKKYQEKYQHVLIDEFQDTNYTQYNLIKLLCSLESLSNRSLVVVGDDSQSIYKFRGAAISNILEFKKDYKDPKIVTLTDNYRSTQEILDISYKVIKNNDPYTLESMLGISKKLKACGRENPVNSEIKVMKCTDLDSEVNFVVSKIKEVLNQNNNLSFKDIAILVRANSHLEPYILELRKEGIPYQVYGNKGLYDKEEVSTVICLLNLLIDPSDNNNLFRCLFIESLNIEQELVLKLLSTAKSKKTILWQECENSLDKNIRNFVSLIKKFQKHLANQLPSDLMFNFLQEIKYVSKFSLEETLENELAIKNLDLFLKRVREIERSMLSENNLTPNLVEFMDYFNLILEAGENPAQAEFEDLDTVNLLTVHSSKGLEFECVFIPSLINGRFPSTNRGSSFDIPTELVKDKEILPEGDYFLQEERRLFYVGVTRAKKYLNLSFSLNYGKRERAKSLFLDETGLDVIDYVKEFSEEDNQIQGSLFNLQNDFKIKLSESNIDYKINSISYTALNTYKTCPLKYKYQFILNIPTKQSKALSFGNTIHETLKEYHQQKTNRKVSLNEILDMYKKNWQPYGFDDRDNQIEYYKHGIDVLTRYYEKYNNVDIKSRVIEKNFKFKLGDIDVSGKIDRIDLLPDGKYEIIDYKTGSSKTEKEVRNDNQLTLYKLAASEVFGFDVEKLTYFFLEDDLKVTTERNSQDIEKLKNEVLEVSEKLKTKKFPANPSNMNCNFCDFKEICPSAYKD
jgi:DNA helicase-2/ATP-dependent DNA helicase PcrA